MQLAPTKIISNVTKTSKEKNDGVSSQCMDSGTVSRLVLNLFMYAQIKCATEASQNI